MVTGGRNGESTTNLCEVYDTETDSWESMVPMGQKRWSHAAVEVRPGVVYVCGGRDGGEYLNSIEFFTETTNLWESIAIDEHVF